MKNEKKEQSILIAKLLQTQMKPSHFLVCLPCSWESSYLFLQHSFADECKRWAILALHSVLFF